MSKSLIRKNQLHPDIADLVSGYGNDFFITQEELVNAIQIAQQESSSDAVLISGNQTIDGIKTFNKRPVFNGSGLATTGELGGSTAFNGFRRITRSTIEGVTPGGTDVTTFLTNLFYPFAQASVTLNSFPLQELGTSITTINFIGNIVPGSLDFGTDINTVTAFSNNTARTPIITTPSLNNTTFSQSINLGGTITNNVSNCFVRINTKNQAGNVITLDSSPAQTIFFEAPMYAGSGSLNLMTLGPTNPGSNVRNILSGQGITNPGTNNGKALIFKPASRIVRVTTNGYYYFVYPDSWGLLSRIEDTNFDLNFISDFTSGTVALPLINGTTHVYRWYRNINQISLTDYGVRYIF